MHMTPVLLHTEADGYGRSQKETMPSLTETYIPLAFVLVTALTFHEFAHAWVAYKLGDDTAYRQGRVTLNPIVHLDVWGTICFIVTQGFGWAKPVPVNARNFSHPRRDDILVTAAGPFSNLILGFLSGLLFYGLIKHGFYTDLNTQAPLVKLSFRVLQMMVHINFVLMFFNLIPLFPLDGSHIVTNLLPLEQAYQFKRFNESYGPMILIGLVLFGMATPFSPLSVFIFGPVRFLDNMLRSFVFSVL